MPRTVADKDGGPVEAQDQDTAENQPDLVEGDQEAGPETGSRPVEMEGESTPQREGVLGEEEKEEVVEEEESAVGGNAGPVEPQDGASGADAGLAEGEEPTANDSDPEAAEGVAASGPEITYDPEQHKAEEKKRRRQLIALLAVLLLALSSTVAIFVRYVTRPAPLVDLLPVSVRVNYAPHYLFSIYGLNKPVGVALSPQADRIYVAETGGERLVKIFDRDGNPLGSFAPPRTGQAERSPVYLATDASGRVFVADRLQHALFVYDREGRYLDTILGPDMTLSEYVSKHTEGLRPGATFAYDAFEAGVYYQQVGEAEQTLPVPDPSGWSPLGVRIDATGRLLITDVSNGQQSVHEIPGDVLLARSWHDFDPHGRAFGTAGQGDDQLLFPNVAVTDSQGRIHVTDGNNGRISVWDDQGGFLFSFGQGAGEGALNLPRGADIDARDRLHVVDAVGQAVRVYDVSEHEPSFLFAFGNWGLDDGQFDYPNDIALDATGRLYIADRENNRIQVWSY
jgi:DNA-binding beta-propeller fold protein YncE